MERNTKVDERAEKFFTKMQGSYVWNSAHTDLEPTRTARMQGKFVCCYCGEVAYPIQSGLSRPYYLRFDGDSAYDVTGYCCVCKKAMDEVAVRARIRELEQRHAEEIQELKQEMPVPNIKVLVHRKIDELKRLAAKDFVELRDVVDPGSYEEGY